MLIKAVACMKTHTSVTESQAYVRQGPYINKLFKIYPGTLVSVLCCCFFVMQDPIVLFFCVWWLWGTDHGVQWTANCNSIWKKGWHTYSCISSEQIWAYRLFGRWTNECDPDLEPLVEENSRDICMEYNLCVSLVTGMPENKGDTGADSV